MITEINPNYGNLESRVRALPSTFDHEGTPLHQGRNQVKEMRWGNQTVVVKRYKRPNIFMKLQFALLNTCKAKKAYIYGNLFLKDGISTPTPIAYAIDGRWPIIRNAYFACEAVDGICLNDTLTPDDDATIRSLAAEIVRMHSTGLMHGDLNLTNIYADANGNYHFIDTNRTRIKKHPSQNDCADNLMRLTPQRPLLSKIAREYALLKGWDPEAFASKVLASLDAFHRKKAFLKKIKSLCLKRK